MKGKTYEEIHGVEKAKELRKQRSISLSIPKIPLVCPVCNKTVYLLPGIIKNRKFCSHKCSCIYRGGKTYEEIYGVERAKEIRKKQKAGWTEEKRKKHAEKIPWNKGLSKETHPSLMTVSKKMMGHKHNLGIKRSKETKQKMSEGKIRFWNSPKGLKLRKEKTIKRVPFTCPVCNKVILVPPRTLKSRKVCSIACLHRRPSSKTNDTDIELILQNTLKQENIQFDTQVVVPLSVGYCIIDIVPKTRKIAIFADGNHWHNYPEGTERDKYISQELTNQNWKVLRFWGSEIRKNLSYCSSKLLEVI